MIQEKNIIYVEQQKPGVWVSIEIQTRRRICKSCKNDGTKGEKTTKNKWVIRKNDEQTKKKSTEMRVNFQGSAGKWIWLQEIERNFDKLCFCGAVLFGE